MGPSLDPLRYGLRALEEMAREQASVAPPAQTRATEFSPHPLLRSPSREGAALSLRFFSEAEDDATALVLGGATTQRFAPIPPRAASFFEAHAAAVAADLESSLTIGFPLAMFVQQGAARVAPLFSRGGARARWSVGGAAWRAPSGARPGTALPPPDALVLELGADEPYAAHFGVWHYLFGLEGDVVAAISSAGTRGAGALVRAATRALESGGGEATEVETPETESDPLTREDLAALADAAMRRAPASRALKCHPHGLAMLPPRGDPTSGLRLDLRAVADEVLPPRGPLAVYLGASAAPPRSAHIFTSGKAPPTTSQLAAACAFEASEDLVAVCGPPGCGKTALLHHVAAQAVLDCALGKLWSDTAPARAAAWPLVVTSTNNAAVDHALAPFAGGPGLPAGLRLGNRRALAETTAASLASAITWLETLGPGSLVDARAAFEARATPLRAFLRDWASTEKERASAAMRLRALEHRAQRLREELAAMGDARAPSVPVESAELEDAERALTEHAEAAQRLPALHLDRDGASVARACAKWARANALRAPRIDPVLAALGLERPFRDLDPAAPEEDIARQSAEIEKTRAILGAARRRRMAPALRQELEEATVGLTSATKPEGPRAPALDPELYDLALAVRDAWARTHRVVLVQRLAAARDALRAEWSETRGGTKPLPVLLRELAPLFPIAGCTLLSMRASFPFGAGVIERLVIDEAAQCAPIYAVPALARARRAMLTGDVAQLPPVYTLAPHVDDRLARGLDADAVAPFRMSAASTSSAQAVAEPRARARLALTEHFRSQAPIVALASRWSGYTLDVRTAPSSLTDIAPRLEGPVMAIPVPGVGARAPEGVVNEAEAAYAIHLVEEIVARGVAASEIAVLTPFVGQSVRIERELALRGLIASGGVLVSTVHRLQGGERRVVVFSVTATEQRHLRWLGERPHLLHVAASRAQDHLVILVDPDAAARHAMLLPIRELLERSR